MNHSRPITSGDRHWEDHQTKKEARSELLGKKKKEKYHFMKKLNEKELLNIMENPNAPINKAKEAESEQEEMNDLDRRFTELTK